MQADPNMKKFISSLDDSLQAFWVPRLTRSHHFDASERILIQHKTQLLNSFLSHPLTFTGAGVEGRVGVSASV